MEILIIEDDPTLSQNISLALQAENWRVEQVFDGLLAERMLRRRTFDCIIMDINLPGKTGFDLCLDFRSHNTATPVLMLTAFSELDDKVKGYQCGADDYLTKPFFMRELVLRIQALVKRYASTAGGQKQDIVTAGDIVIWPAQKKVIRQNQEIKLTPREYQILMILCQRNGEIIPKNELIKEIWGTTFDSNTNTIEVYINFLRNKVDKPFGKSAIKTKIGFGYYLDFE